MNSLEKPNETFRRCLVLREERAGNEKKMHTKG